jgi:tRNA dimethylallyltransferase
MGRKRLQTGQKILLIVGPTAVGKTNLSIELAKKFNAEIISGDSMQVYRKLDVGTAKITPSEMRGIKHYLIDECNIDERFSVALFIEKCRKAIKEIQAQGKLPLIVGGTGFYLQALLDNFSLGNDKYDSQEVIRNKWHAFAKEKGQQALWEELAKTDLLAAQKIPVTNERRVVRALEVIEKTGRLFSQQADQASLEFDPFLIGLTTQRDVLYERINRRVDLMLTQGLLEEVKYLYAHGGSDLPSGKGIGYKEFYPYLQGLKTLEECSVEAKKNSRHYAKRQLTWFRNKMNVNWYDLVLHPEELTQVINDVEIWLEH